MSEWKKYKLEDVLEALIDYRGKTPKKTLSGIPLITAKIVKDGFIQEPNEFIAKEDYESWMTRGIPKIGDVVLTVEAPLGEVAQIKSTYIALAQRVITLRGKEDLLDNGYLKYFLQSDIGQSRLKERETGTTVTGIKQSELKLISIDCPDITIQHRIASILSSLDDKIELNRQTNQTLEMIAQTLFKEMCLPKGDELPDGWRIGKLDEVAEFLNGLALQKYPAENETDYLPVIKIRELKNGITNSTDKASKKVPLKYKIRNGDLLFSWSATLEVMFWCYGEGALNQHLFKVTSDKYPLWFCYMLINHHLENFRKIASDKTTTMGHIQRRHLTEALCFIPKNFIEIVKLVSPIIEQIKSNNYENQTLINLRDSLLPKLMKGEIDVTPSNA